MLFSSFNVKCITSAVMLITSTYVIAQVPEIDWQHNYGGSGWDIPFKILSTPSDSGYIVAGVSGSIDGDVTESNGYDDYWVVKLDSLGNILWQNTYGGSSFDQCNDIVLTSDGGYLLAGYIYSNDGDITLNHGDVDYWVVKISVTGVIEWQKSFGGIETDFANRILTLPSGNFMIIGESSSNDGDVLGHHNTPTKTNDIWVIEIDPSGNLLSSKCYGSYFDESAGDIILLGDGIAIVGTTFGSGGDVTSHDGATDFWLFKIDFDGNIIWDRSFGGDDYDWGYSIGKKTNGDIVICGITSSVDGDIIDYNGGTADALVVIVDSIGNLESSHCFGGSLYDESDDLIVIDNNQILICGSTASIDGDMTDNNGSTDFWVAMIDTIGNVHWQKSLGGSIDEAAYAIATTPDENSYITLGRSHSSVADVEANFGSYDFWVVKLNICETLYFLDADGDGFGDINNDSIACEIPLGYVSDSTDCNDSANYINHGAKELCNYLDDNCNGAIDEGMSFIQSFEDLDGDSFGNEAVDSISCEIPLGFVIDNTDCNDNNPDIYPGAPELLNGFDDDCDQIADEGLSITDIVKNTISIFPNPVNNILFIQSDVTHQITIVNQLGETILSNNLFIGLNTISVENFPSGVYWVKAENGEMVVWVKE